MSPGRTQSARPKHGARLQHSASSTNNAPSKHNALDLAHYEDPELYEAPFLQRSHDVEYFVDLACKQLQSEERILEYGCGAGRVTLPLAQAGFQVFGVDRSRTMLTSLEQRVQSQPELVRERIKSQAADMRRFEVDERFALVLATFNVVAHLPTRTDMARWLSHVRLMLAPGALLVFDVPLPSPDELEADPDEHHQLPRFRHPRTKQWIENSERFDYDPARQLLLVESRLQPSGAPNAVDVPLVLRQWFPQEIAALLRYEGFEVELRADYSNLPAVLAEEAVIVIARNS